MARPDISRSVKAAFVACTTLVIAFASPTLAHAAPGGIEGTLNRSFGTSGTLTLPFVASFAASESTDAQGRVVASGAGVENETSFLFVVRYLGDGRLDPTFGTGGVARVENRPLDDPIVGGASAMGPGGRIMLGGSLVFSHVTVIARLTSDGRLDPSFNGSGFAVAQKEWTSAVTVDAAGRAVVAGGSGAGAQVWRFRTDGHIDSTFGGGGTARIDSSKFTSIASVATDTSNRVVVSGSANGAGFVGRLTSSGQPDPAFAANGMRKFAALAQLASVAVQPDGRIVAAGNTTSPPVVASVTSHMAAARVLDNGSPDSSFGADGVAVVQPGGSVSIALDLHMLPGGSLLLVGAGNQQPFPEDTQFPVVARLLPNGRLDPGFGCSGGTWLRLGDRHGLGTAIAVSGSSAYVLGETQSGGVQATISRLDLGVSAPGGYTLVTTAGALQSFGSAPACAPLDDLALNRPIVGVATTVAGRGEWLVASDGGIFAEGEARFFGSTGSIRLNQPIVGMAATPSGHGYWLVASDGGVFAFGDARFFGSTGSIRLNQPIVGMAATSSGHGYRLVASDGGVFAFGDARFAGSTGSIRLNQPIVGMATTSSDHDYWLVASDGGVFAFGDARFFGSTGSIRLNQPIVGMAATSSGHGYWLVASDGGIFAFADALFKGSAASIPPGAGFVGIAATP
jgi:uncharacterized delta-60 repeat protein